MTKLDYLFFAVFGPCKVVELDLVQTDTTIIFNLANATKGFYAGLTRDIILRLKKREDEIVQSVQTPEHLFKFKRSTKCPYQVCHRGYGRVHGKIRQSNNNVIKFGWTCQKCAENSYSPSNDTSNCIQCPSTLISNVQRTECIDPYTNIYLKDNRRMVLLCFLTSGLCIGMTLFISIVFVRFRKTPMVTSADFTMSCLHLMHFLAIFAIIPTLSFTEHTGEGGLDCTWKLVSITILCSSNLSFVVIKSQKMIQVFSSNVRLTKKEITRTYVTQFAVYLFILLMATAIMVLCLNIKEIAFVTRENQAKLQRVWSCNTGFHIQFQVVFMIFVQLFCFVQSFRARNVPSLYSDAWTILYASFVMSFGLVVYFPVSIFHRNKGLFHEESIAISLTIVLNFVLLQLILFGRKVYNILFMAKKNNKNYYRQKMMLNIQEKVTEKCAGPSTQTTSI